MAIWNIFKKKDTSYVIRLTASDSFGLIANQIIYVEDSYDPFFNKYFDNNFDKITSVFKEKSEELDFIYLPQLQKEILSSTEDLTELLNYFLPYSNTNTILNKRTLEVETSTAIHSRKLFNSFNYQGKIQPGFLRLTSETDESGNFIFEYLLLVKPNYLEKQIADYASTIPITPTETIKVDSNTSVKADKKVSIR